MICDNKYEFQNQYHLNLDAFFLQFMKERFQIKKVFKKNIEQLLSAIFKYCNEDKRINLFKNFLGMSERKIKTEILDCYLLLLKNLSVSFYKIFDDFETSKSLLMSLENCLGIYLNKFTHHQLHMLNIDLLLKNTQVFKNNKELEVIPLQEKKDLLFLNRFYNKNQEYFKNLLLESKNNNITLINQNEISEKLYSANQEFGIDLNNSVQIFKRHFKYDGLDEIQLQSLFEFFLDKFYFKVKIIDFVDITVDALINLYDKLEKKILNIWDKVLFLKNKEVIFFKEFEVILTTIIGNNNDNMWKINLYFR